MKILVTGGAGYIGSHVVLCCLQAGHEVTVLDDLSNASPIALRRVGDLAGRKAEFVRGDVRDARLLADMFAAGGFDAVMHFAGLKAVGESVEKPIDYYDVNVNGSLVLTRAMQAAGVRLLVFSSTASVYGDQPVMPLTEGSALSPPSSPYGHSKRMVEQVLSDLCCTDARLGVAVLRYFNPVGAHPSGQIGEDPRGTPANLVPYAMQVASGMRAELAVFGDDYPTPDGTGMRDYIHVMDLAAGHLAALSYLAGQGGYHIWNLGTGQGHSVREVISTMQNIIGRPLPHRIAPRRAGDTAQCWADPSRAMQDLNWRAQRSLADMLVDHWNWQSQNPRGYAGE